MDATETINLGFLRSLRGKLMLLCLGISLIPLMLIGWLAYEQAREALHKEISNELSAVREIKAVQVQQHFAERIGDIQVLARAPFVAEALRAFDQVVEQDMAQDQAMNETGAMKHYRPLYLNKPELTDAGDGSEYSALHGRYHPLFSHYQKTYGYYDIFLIEPHHGTIVYSVFKEDDFGTNLNNGVYASSNLAEAFQIVATSGQRELVKLVDFAHYSPSRGAAAFLATPIYRENNLLGVLAFQVSIEHINELMQSRAGMGDTGETYLVGADKLMRSDSRFLRESTLLEQKVDTPSVNQALRGNAGVEIITDYRGEQVISAYQPLELPGVNWVIIAEKDVKEAFAATEKLFLITLGILGGAALVVSFIALYFSRALTRPLLAMTRVARRLARGELNQQVDFRGRDEIGLMAEAFREMTLNLRQVVGEIRQVSQNLAQGQLSSRIETEFVGDFVHIQQATNQTAATLQAIINEISEAFARFAGGQLTTRITGAMPGEFSRIKLASNGMAEDLQAVIGETSQALDRLASGEECLNISREFPGDFEQIKRALQTTARKLAEATEQNRIQNWLKSGQAQLGERLSGDKPLIQLAEEVLNFLVPYIEAQVGAFYLLYEAESENPYLKLVASHAYVWRKSARHEFYFGEGMVGQAALERKPFVISQAPEDYLSVQSGLGESRPRHILVAPFMHEGELKGVLELASLGDFSPRHLDFLEQILPALAIAINTAEARTRMKELLTQTQAQSEELRQQQAALQQSNEELQSQSEELRSQQEELRQINEELEQRTRDLEKQQDEVNEKNRDLEKARATVQAKAEELELASKYKSEFLANMSHELRTPLNSLLILAQMLAENKNGNLDDKQVEYARTIYHSGGDLLNLINDILDLSKVEAGHIELQPEELDLSAITESMEQKFRHMAEQKDLEFNLNLAGNLPATVYMDEQRVKQIITNLLGNAFKFTRQGGVTLDISRPDPHTDLSRSGLNPAHALAFSVSDTGIGIPEEKQKVIFEAFQQADGAVNRKYGGTGLGLSISRQLTQLLGGEIQLHSVADQGSRFTVFLPERVQAGTADPGTACKTAARPAPPPVKNLPDESAGESVNSMEDDRESLESEDKSILIIEDDRNFSSILLELGREKGFKCLVAEDGRDGLSMARRYKPGAIILDLGLPLVDGWTVMEKLKDNPETRHIPVHFVSGSDYSIDARRLGAIGYSLKPVSMADLGEAFKKIESFLSQQVKNLLIVSDNQARQQAMEELVKETEAASILAHGRASAWKELNLRHFDCLVLDVDAEEGRAIELLDQLHDTHDLSRVPVIIYAERDLSEDEQRRVQKCTANVTVKEAHSDERLLDEVTLFLHQVEGKLPDEKQKLLHRARKREGVLEGKRVLLVDDDSRNVFALTAALEEKGMEVLTASNGREALQALNHHPDTDVILMDIMMPEMDGYEATRQIRAKQKYLKLPIIALTAKAMKGDKAKCIEAGANDYLSKPIEPARLISLLRVWLAK